LGDRYTYVHTQAIAIRRQIDARSDVVSLGRILREIIEELENGSPGWVVHKSLSLEEARDLKGRLDSFLALLARLVNKRIAHTDTGTVNDLLRIGPLHDAMDNLFDVFKVVEVFVTGASTPDLRPIIQHDWEAVFRLPWLPPRQ
jgi:hypothetical protein